MNSQESQKYYRYFLGTPYGWETVEYRVFPVDTPESEIGRDWREAVSDYATDVYAAFEESFTIDRDADLEQFVADSYELSWAEQIPAQVYFKNA